MVRRMTGVALVAWILITLAGCTTMGQEDTTRSDLAARLSDAQQAHAAALALWDRVIFGEMVSCQDAIPVPAPLTLAQRDLDKHPQAVLIQARLNEAIQHLRDSSDLWNIECADSRGVVPLTMAREGRAAALAAGPLLDEAAVLLAAWPG